MERFHKRLGTVLMISMGLLAAALLYKSFKVVMGNGFERGEEILGAAYEQVAECALQCYLPQVLYDGKNSETGDFFEQVVQMAKEHIPGVQAAEPEEETPEIVEDETTEQAIIEENERMIQTKMTEENQAKVQQNNNQNEDDEDKNDGGTQQTTASTPPQPNNACTIVSPISLEQLQNFGYLLNHFFVVDGNTTGEASQINLDELWNRDMKMTTDNTKPQILIYHTHSQEEFADSAEGDPSTSVVGVGDHLTQILQDTYGYQVIHVTNTFDLVDGRVERSKAYDYAKPVIEQLLQENPSVEVVIDLHRDGVDESKHLVTEIDGKQTAKIMFFNGLSRTKMNGDIDYLPNPYIEDNLSFSFQLEYLAKQCYPDFTRCIYLKGYRYNLHVRPKSLLLEVGAQTNTVEEAMNAMEPFAKILNSILQGTNR